MSDRFPHTLDRAGRDLFSRKEWKELRKQIKGCRGRICLTRMQNENWQNVLRNGERNTRSHLPTF